MEKKEQKCKNCGYIMEYTDGGILGCPVMTVDSDGVTINGGRHDFSTPPEKEVTIKNNTENIITISTPDSNTIQIDTPKEETRFTPQSFTWAAKTPHLILTVGEVLTHEKIQEIGRWIPKPPKEDGSYYKVDHSHCWSEKNPPCGQKLKHFECCLCEELHPEIKKPLQQTKSSTRREVLGEMELKMNEVYTALESEKPPATINKYEHEYNVGMFKGRLNAAERISIKLFNKDGDSLTPLEHE